MSFEVKTMKARDSTFFCLHSVILPAETGSKPAGSALLYDHDPGFEDIVNSGFSCSQDSVMPDALVRRADPVYVLNSVTGRCTASQRFA